MSLLNYTTKVSVDRSVSQIMKMLSVAGASAIMVENDDVGDIVSLSFKIMVHENTVAYRLPINWMPVFQIIMEDRRVPKNKKTEEHAKCVAWRILKDWVEAQLAILETNMVKLDQIFLPYAMVGKDKTLYEHVQSQNLLSGPKND